MTFEISPEYFNMLRKFQKQGWAYFVIMLLVSVVFFIGPFSKSLKGMPIMGRIICIMFYLLMMGFVYYLKNIEPVKGIPNTISAVEILQDRLVFRTSEFKVPFYGSKQKTVVIFPRDIRIKEYYYPVRLVYDLDKPVWKIINEKEELYLILDFFDKNLYSEMAKLF